jgi:hypothetical protein
MKDPLNILEGIHGLWGRTSNHADLEGLREGLRYDRDTIHIHLMDGSQKILIYLF